MLNNNDIIACCKYGFSVDMLIDSVECLIDDIECEQEITEVETGHLKRKIKLIRKHEKGFKEMLEIKD